MATATRTTRGEKEQAKPAMEQSQEPAEPPAPPRRSPPEGMRWRYCETKHEWMLVTMNEPPHPDDDTNKSHVIHTVLPSDTLVGLCLKYKVSATKLRQVNGFSGSNLRLAPATLVIPKPYDNDTLTEDDKVKALVKAVPHLGECEARAYLEMGQWELEPTIHTAKTDWEWKPSPDLRQRTPLFSHFVQQNN